MNGLYVRQGKRAWRKNVRLALSWPANAVAYVLGVIVKRAWVLEARRVARSFRAVGENVTVSVGCVFEPPWNVSVGNDVYIGPDCYFLTSNARIVIGDGVMFGPQVGIVTGNHNISIPGKRMIDIKEKRPCDDEDVIIENDVWIGFRATILKGVRIGTGSVVAAGAVVTRDVRAMSVVAGVPAREIASRAQE